MLTVKKLFIILLAMIFSNMLLYVHAAPSPQAPPRDRGLISAMDETDMNYNIDADGDAAVAVQFVNDRSQLLWVTTKTEIIRDQRVRDVYSVVGEIPAEDVTVEMLMELMTYNARCSYGAFQAIYSEDDENIIIYYGGKVSVDAESALLAAIIIEIAEIADRQEQHMFGLDEY